MLSFLRKSPRYTNGVLAVAFVLATFGMAGSAQADAGFKRWIKDFYSVARKSGIKRSTYDAVFSGVNSPDPDVLKAARYQPEFTTKVWEYLDSRVNDTTIQNGIQKKSQYSNWLSRIEKKFGVDRHILLAIWSMESSYGAALERDNTLRRVSRSLATLAYQDRKRRKFARTQLISAMKLVQRGDVSARNLRGSWAGAMGHTQFIPTSFQTWGVDMDGDGRRNVWTSIPDALASAANLLKKNGWRSGQTWGYEVRLPRGFNTRLANKSGMTLGKFRQLGVKRANGKAFPRPGQKAVLKLLAGKNGPAFLMTKNFYVLKSYNNADKYALGVGHLADRLAGYGDLAVDWPRGYKPLKTEDERKEVQSHLLKLGYYDGEIDGKLGSGSRAAILKYQKSIGFTANGYASKKLLSKLRGG